MIDATAYGKALYDLAAEGGVDETVRQQLSLVRDALSPSYLTLMDTPAVAKEEKIALLRQAFDGVEEILLNFLCILCEKRSMHRFFACEEAYRACFDEAHGILRATAITAVAMQPQQCEALERKLAQVTGKTVLLTNRVDASLIGGITLRYGGVQLDDSIRTRLDKLRSSLADTIV